MLETLSQHPDSGRQQEVQFSYTRQGLPQAADEYTHWQQGRINQRGNCHYDYDRAGRLISKRQLRPGFRPEQWHYQWDSRNQLRVVITPTAERWIYRYDPFGRRISKRCEQTGEEIHYLWDGDQIAEVRHWQQGQLRSRRHWVWRGWEMLVQQYQSININTCAPSQMPTVYVEQGLQAAASEWQTDFAVSQQNGAVQGLYNPQGKLSWQAGKNTLWGLPQRLDSTPIDPGLAFAGQLRDGESGLCYNRFRYYDPLAASYISPDPIGILGGENNYGYVPNPVNWIDPLGLAKCRLMYVGKTPGKNSRTGREVIERMRGEGKIRGTGNRTQFLGSNNKWHPLREADMSHKIDAVAWWNKTGRQYGAKAKKVRKWMLDSNNYYLDHYSINKSQGASLGLQYLPPLI